MKIHFPVFNGEISTIGQWLSAGKQIIVYSVFMKLFGKCQFNVLLMSPFFKQGFHLKR